MAGDCGLKKKKICDWFFDLQAMKEYIHFYIMFSCMHVYSDRLHAEILRIYTLRKILGVFFFVSVFCGFFVGTM
jgi:hypothetical protein